MAKRSRLQSNPTLDTLVIIVLLFVSLVTLFPVLWAFGTSIKPDIEVTMYPPRILPIAITLQNYYKVLFQSDFLRYFFNSILITGIGIVITTMVAAHAAYALTHFEIRGKRKIMFIILMTSMIPPVALLVPLYLMTVKAGLYNTRIILIIIYAAWRAPVLTWILQGFFAKLPKAIVEAGIIDGCSKPMTFYRLVLPISQPGIVSASLLSAVYIWNDFLVSFSFTTKNEIRMLSVGLYQYISQYGIQWGQLMAAVMISIIPIIVLFICLQGKFVSGMAAGAVKG
ncbi:carbohydrate ABC transporter permease [uncultured Sphaerochaeta sp.]|uniref:carbohydrate ABC transporter permease n=1 Tax=uncultured Sphaerochaeta sp. TaxID=886478 RepID=UPI002A0A9FEC|nr:carbohydrate ABC transporter permease [uncultured Sphaerochaeta sp.]